MRLIKRFLAERRASTAVEYGLILALLSLVIVAGIGRVGNAVEEMFADQDRELQRAFRE
jgi:pilus assembly protein Flp/PilA